ncbi:hypothetical protein BS50DRAFT_141392 [Corynespora cassiicola Philippines]|uniref:Uncharacterized protein n=1 Tax=Corynespora cassiicola Philippines TaxID=1448308 RepID=A0A2T2N9Z2_CORCC|nr:hypothetical protein BS50DRAFT_141392 [Corynespora cassiicola Philippines]
MPYCTSCGYFFEGRGNYCGLHNPYYPTKTRDHHIYTDSAEPLGIRYGTGRFQNQYSNPHRHRPHSKVHRAKGHDIYDYNNDALQLDNNQGALTKYNVTNDIAISNSPRSLNTMLHAAATVFQDLAANHAIDHMRFSVAPNGTRYVSAHANKEREQCQTCQKWFPDSMRLDHHKREFGSGCEAHAMCFRDDEAYFHGCDAKHDRCFVRGCASIYRREGGWKNVVVEDHVRTWHQ